MKREVARLKSIGGLRNINIKATDTRMQRRLQQIEKLDATDKRQVLQLIDAFIERDQLKRDVREPAAKKKTASAHRSASRG